MRLKRRKEILEEIAIQMKEYEEQSKKEKEARKLYEAKMAQLERKVEERKRQRIFKRKMLRLKMRLEQLKKSGWTLNIDEEDLEKMDPGDLMQKQVEQLDKEKKELMARLKNQEKHVDQFARACRVIEITLLDEQFREQSVTDCAFWEQQEKARIETLKAKRELVLKHSSRLMRMMEDKNQFVAKLTKARQSVFKDRLKDFEQMLASEKVKRLNERKERRKAERKLKRQQEKEEAKRRAEEERKLLEAKERVEYFAKKQMKKTKKRRTKKKKQRERELEERLAQEH